MARRDKFPCAYAAFRFHTTQASLVKTRLNFLHRETLSKLQITSLLTPLNKYHELPDTLCKHFQPCSKMVKRQFKKYPWLAFYISYLLPRCCCHHGYHSATFHHYYLCLLKILASYFPSRLLPASENFACVQGNDMP